MPNNKWTDEFLDEMRMTGDLEGDKAAVNLFVQSRNPEIFKELHKMATNDAHVPESFHLALKDFFEEETLVFTQEEEDMLKLGGQVFNKFGFRIAGLLFFKALPTGYLCPDPAHVLGSTKLLVDQAARRVFETAQYLFDVCHTEWKDPEGRGLISIKKVRLMHSGMRIMIAKNREVQWDEKKRGKPINQEELVLTLQLFSLASIEGLHQMGIRLTKKEQEAYFYKWKIIGRLMGIDPRLEPVDVADGWALHNKILQRSVRLPNVDGPNLARELIDVIHDHCPPFMSHKSFEKITMYFVNYKNSYKYLGFHKPGFMEILFDKIVYRMVNFKLWSILHPHDVTKKAKVPWYVKISKKMLIRRFGLQDHWDEDYKTDLMEVICKKITQSLEAEAAFSHKSSLVITNDLMEEWQLGSFDFNAADELVDGDETT